MRSAAIRALCVGWLGALALPLAARGGELTVPDALLGHRVAPLLLLSRPDVQADLKLTAEQVAAAGQEAAELHNQAALLQRRAVRSHDPNGAEIIAARRAIDERGRRWIDAQLGPEQRQRLDQIDLQWEGPAALISRPSLADALRLSDLQRQALQQAVERRNALRVQGRCRPEDERTLAQQALAALTAEQREQWRAMLGRPLPIATARPDAPQAKR